MRWVFALLLLGNSAFFVAMRFPQDKAGSESMANHAPYHAENIRLIAEGEVPPAPAPQPAAAAVEHQVCLAWGPFSEQAAAQAKNALAPLKLGDNDVSILNPATKGSSWWVYIPPQKTKQDATRKVEELKNLGIQDSFVMQDNNKWRYAVSLGVFSSQAAAGKYLAQIREKGVRSAKAGPRNQDAGHASIIIKTGGANIEAELVKLKQGFPATDLKAVPCPQ